MFGFKERRNVRKNIGTGDGACANDEFTGNIMILGYQLFFKLIHIINDGQGLRVEYFCFSCWSNRSSQSVEKFTAKAFFQRFYVFADRRLAYCKKLRGLSEAAAFIDGDESFQLFCFYGPTPDKSYILRNELRKITTFLV